MISLLANNSRPTISHIHIPPPSICQNGILKKIYSDSIKVWIPLMTIPAILFSLWSESLVIWHSLY